MNNPFHAKEVDEESLRPTHEVFSRSATEQPDEFRSRFASSGKYTSEQLEAGEDVNREEERDEEPDFDPDDKRSLYDRLKEQRDAKQEEFDHQHQFKNQVRRLRPMPTVPFRALIALRANRLRRWTTGG